MTKCKCGERAEWADEYCQMCWEAKRYKGKWSRD
jgi:hypothetical protein